MTSKDPNKHVPPKPEGLPESLVDVNSEPDRQTQIELDQGRINGYMGEVVMNGGVYPEIELLKSTRQKPKEERGEGFQAAMDFADQMLAATAARKAGGTDNPRYPALRRAAIERRDRVRNSGRFAPKV